MKTKKKKEPKANTLTGSHSKLYEEVSAEIAHRLGEVKLELQWVENNCKELIRVGKSERDLRALVRVKAQLATITEQLRRVSDSLCHRLRGVPLVLGEVGQKQLGL
jgi:hypothetical protein